MDKKNIYQKLFEVKKAGIKLQRDTTAFNYKYATLSQIQEKLSNVMQEQKLLVLHRVENNEVITTIFNTEGGEKDILQSVSSSIPMSEGTKPQDKGSEITYYRRYNLLSLLDLEVEDDDGKKAQDSSSKQDIMDYINRVKAEDDTNAITTIYEEFNKLKWSDKQTTWFKKECRERTDYLQKL